MKLATYNIWDSPAGMPQRLEQLAGEIRAAQADVLCLQEVSDHERHDFLARAGGYKHAFYSKQAGVSLLSRYPLTDAQALPHGACALVHAEVLLLAANVHLPWNSASARETAIVDIVRSLIAFRADYAVLMGDFNCSPVSSVHRFLTGDQSLLGCDAYFFDLHAVRAEIMGETPSATLSFRKNPRWGVVQEKNTIEPDQRFDRIYLRNPYPSRYPQAADVRIFGTAVSEQTRLCASDHYGVAAELIF